MSACGCRIEIITLEYEKKHDREEHRIIYCPLHREAGRLREHIESMTQIVHQAYHTENSGTWRDCPRIYCVDALKAVTAATSEVTK